MNTKTQEYFKAVLHLFKAIPHLGKMDISNIKHDEISNGVFITDEAYSHFDINSKDDIKSSVIDMYGYDLEALNNGFYKSFHSVADKSVEEWIRDQILHYFTTYGFESLGIYDKDSVYIPNEVLQLPEDDSPFQVTIINYISNENIEERVRKMLYSGMALNSKTVEELFTIINYNKIDFSRDVDNVKNKEMRLKMYDYYNTVPQNAEEFLKYEVYKATKSTMLIQNDATFRAISYSANVNFDDFYKIKITKLASIFHRYKKIFLAFKHSANGNRQFCTFINQINRIADKYHKPKKEKILDIVTHKDVDINELEKELENVTIFKRISLANSILFRRNDPEHIIYLIRNGLAYVEEYKNDFNVSDDVLHVIMKNIVDTVRKNVEGKKIFIPNNFVYAMPTSEKMFWNNIPFNSSIILPPTVVLGVHWLNTNGYRTDLDLHMKSEKYDVSWYNYGSNYKNERNNREVLFTGDMTDAPAPNGATEAYYLNDNVVDDELISFTLNIYSGPHHVDFKFIVDECEKDRVDKNYLIDSHTMKFCIDNYIEKNGMSLGFLDVSAPEKKVFYFSSSSISKSIAASYGEKAKYANSAMRTMVNSCLKLNDVLKMAGAKFEKEDDEEWDIVLDPKQVTKDIFLDFIK